jgi:hypothetical protein
MLRQDVDEAKTGRARNVPPSLGPHVNCGHDGAGVGILSGHLKIPTRGLS